ncbi:MAG: hypothetical protein WC385_03575 [Candidatus Paceibacterota bacterium]|jgi:hypothetical protein
MGFAVAEEKRLKAKIARILEKMGVAEEAIFTTISDRYACAVTAQLGPGMQVVKAPYVIVRDSNKKEMGEIGQKINDELNLDVELESIDGFLPKTDKPKKSPLF